MILRLVLVLISVLYSAPQLQIRACCGTADNCQVYERAEDLFGISCCGNQPFNTYTSLCCNGIVRDRKRGGSYAELCCGNDVLRYDQTCCEGVVHNVINGDCCGQAVYSKMDKSFLCCNATLARTVSPTDVCCGSSVFDGGRTQICCGDSVSDKSQFDSCCNSTSGNLQPFKSTAQFCCDGVQSRNANLSCCYLRNGTDIRPQAYNTNNACCLYPYDRMYPKSANGTCVPSG